MKHSNSLRVLTTLIGVAIVKIGFGFAAAPGSHGAIGINFVGRATTMGSAEIAGVVPRARWNNAIGASRATGLALFDETGTATTATVRWTSDNVWSTPIWDRAGNNRLMKGYLDTGSSRPTVVTVAGLEARAYDVYIYADGDNAGSTRTGTYQVSGPGVTTTAVTLVDGANANFSGTFTRATGSTGNYVKFSVTSTGFTLTATPAPGSSTQRAPVNAIHIVPSAAAPLPDFSLSVAPGSATVNPGGSTTYGISAGAINGFSGPVALGVSGLPSGASAFFTPAAVTAPGSATLTVNTSSNVPVGSATVTITGTSGALSHSAPATLSVMPLPLPTFSLSGVVSPSLLGAGATLTLGGAGTGTTTADGLGQFVFTGLTAGDYAVMPGKSGVTFTPTSRIVTITGASATGIDFLASTPVTHSMSGTITSIGGAGTTLTLTGPVNATTTADSLGQFVVSGLTDGTYTATPSKTGYLFAPASRSVTIQGASVTGVSFAAMGPTRDRANSYDNAWEADWVAHARTILETAGKTAGFVLEMGDSITHAYPYALWARQGQGKTVEDIAALSWARATSWGTGNSSVTNKNGWYLAAADTTVQRGMTSSSGLTTSEFLSGCCNGGPIMPSSNDPAVARQILANATYTGNLQVDTIISAFGDAQFAVVMLGTNDPGDPANIAALATIVDKLEAQRIVPILSTTPPRSGALTHEQVVQFNSAVRSLAQSRRLPLIDFYQEIVLRRPGTTWSGTLISTDGVHPTGSGGGFASDSNPYASGGDPTTHTTGDALRNVGYLLRSWLTVQKLKEVKLYVIDGVNPQ